MRRLSLSAANTTSWNKDHHIANPTNAWLLLWKNIRRKKILKFYCVIVETLLLDHDYEGVTFSQKIYMLIRHSRKLILNFRGWSKLAMNC